MKLQYHQVGGVIVPEMVAETSVILSASAVVSFGVGSQESSAEQERIISAIGRSSFFIVFSFSHPIVLATL